MEPITITIYGKPATAGSKRGFYNAKLKRVLMVPHNPAKASSWRDAVRKACRDQYEGPMLMGAYGLHAIFHFSRPKSHYRTGKNAGLLRDSAPAFHTTKPDAGKLLRALEDALTGMLWKDDSQGVHVASEKVLIGIDQEEYCVLIVTPLDGRMVEPTSPQPLP